MGLASWTVVGDLIGRGGGAVGALGLTVLSVLYLPNVLIGAAAVVTGSTVQFASSKSKYDACMETKSSDHSRFTAVRHSSKRRPACFNVVPKARNSTSR